ncbi:MAG: DUF1799 domain-containing protein [Rhodoferax sp.]
MADSVEEADLRQQWVTLGVDPDRAAQASVPGRLESPDVGDYELGPQQWAAWEVFLSCETQWRISVGFSDVRYEGLEYSSMESVVRMLGIKRKHQRDLLWMVRVMEGEALRWFNKR